MSRRDVVVSEPFFSIKQEELLSKLRTLRALVAEIDLYDSPCQLLDSQLNEFEVLGEKMLTVADKLRGTLKKVKP